MRMVKFGAVWAVCFGADSTQAPVGVRRKARGQVCLHDGKAGVARHETAVSARPGGWRAVLHQPINFGIAVHAPYGYSDDENQRLSGEYRSTPTRARVLAAHVERRAAED